jgi:phosphohistidine phosphatase
MKLYLVQHAKAASEEADPERPLTEEGRRDVQKVAAFIKPLTLSVECLWHSGKRRAAQTAGVLANAIKTKGGIITHDGLGPNDDVTALRDELVSIEQDIMIVGHLPFLNKLASLLLAGSVSANVVGFKNAGVVCLSWSDDHPWQIEWMVTPELLV